MCLAPERPAAAAGSRRRRLWELSHACHCPLIGVGFPLGLLRKLVGKVGGGAVLADDYEIHVGAVSECAHRNRLSELLQKELERRYSAVLLRFKAARCETELADLWQAAMARGDVAGAFWAGLSHARCSPALEEQMCRDLHMIQHQAGACVRADLAKFEAAQADRQRLQRELELVHARLAAQQQESGAAGARQESELMRLRAKLVGKDSLVDSLRAELTQLRQSLPGLETRCRLSERLGMMEQRERALREQITELRVAARQASAPEAVAQQQQQLQPPAPQQEPAAPEPALVLQDRSVLCVGGRNGSIATYRNLIEKVGAQFAHHDGGLEDNVGQLDASLAAADLVICQTGCISHSAYWRVKDHCKRTGKRCLFIDKPSMSSLARGLQEAAS